MTDKILRCKEVQQAIGLSRSTIYRMIERGDFPRPQKLGLRAIGWRESAIEGWLNKNHYVFLDDHQEPRSLGFNV